MRNHKYPAFIITAHRPGEYPETTIVRSADAAIRKLAAYHIYSEVSYADAVKDAEWCVETVTEALGAAVELTRGAVRIYVTFSLLTEIN